MYTVYRIEFTRGKKILFLILRKNFRGRLNIKIKENAEKIFSFF
jgi:hypothetical protein